MRVRVSHIIIVSMTLMSSSIRYDKTTHAWIENTVCGGFGKSFSFIQIFKPKIEMRNTKLANTFFFSFSFHWNSQVNQLFGVRKNKQNKIHRSKRVRMDDGFWSRNFQMNSFWRYSMCHFGFIKINGIFIEIEVILFNIEFIHFSYDKYAHRYLLYWPIHFCPIR